MARRIGKKPHPKIYLWLIMVMVLSLGVVATSSEYDPDNVSFAEMNPFSNALAAASPGKSPRAAKTPKPTPTPTPTPKSSQSADASAEATIIPIQIHSSKDLLISAPSEGSAAKTPAQTATAPPATQRAAPSPTPTPPPSSTPTPQPSFTPLPSYEPPRGANIVATHQTDTLGIVIEQLQRDGKTYFIADVRVRGGGQLQNGFAAAKFGPNRRESTLEIVGRYPDCVFAINGDFYNFHSDGVVLRDGIVYRDANRRSNTDLLLIYEDGAMDTMKEADAVADDLLASGVRHVYSFGPMLVQDGEVTDAVSGKGRANEPRCGIGMYEPGHYLVILCDGRRADWSEGCNLKELAELFKERGVPFAYNMDGGVSATMALNGEIVNKPSNGQRSISDILYFAP